MLEEILHTWESTEDGYTKVDVCGENITIDQTLIAQQFGINALSVTVHKIEIS
jgi:hypothetical protein